MPAKIETPFETGLPAKICWCLFLRPSNGYQLAKIVYGKDKNPPTGKIYRNLTILEKNGFVRQTDDIYSIQLEPLIAKLDKILINKNSKLGDSAKFYLRCILESQVFKRVFDTENKIKMNKIQHSKLNFVNNLTLILSWYASSILENEKTTMKNDENLDEIYRDLVRNYDDELLKKIGEPFSKKTIFQYLVKCFDFFLQDIDFKESKRK